MRNDEPITRDLLNLVDEASKHEDHLAWELFSIVVTIQKVIFEIVLFSYIASVLVSFHD